MHSYRLKMLLVIMGVWAVSFYILFSAPHAESREKRPTPEPLTTEKVAQALESTIDPDIYTVGPGDVLTINIWGENDTYYTLDVTPEGKVLIPTIGGVEVGDLTLARAKQKVASAIMQKYRNVTVSVNLVGLRKFRVFVLGEVVQPGVYVAQAVDRVSELIVRAGGLTDWAAERRVQLRRRDGETVYADLYRFKKLGDLSQNPYLNGGDVIYVPPISLTQMTIRVEGQVKEPGVYQLFEGETVRDVLSRVGGFNKSADLAHAYIIRQEGDNPGAIQVDLSTYLETGYYGDDLSLEDGDILVVPAIDDVVYVQGEVETPGAYGFKPDLRVRDYLGMAGGATNDGNPERAKVIGQGGQVRRGLEVVVQRGDTIRVPESFSKRFRDYLTLFSQVASVYLLAKAAGLEF